MSERVLSISRAIALTRMDARAGMTVCTPGKTVPCGKVCRTPKNCAKGKGSQERKSRIGESNLKEFAEVRRSQLGEKRKGRTTNPPEKGGALAVTGGKLAGKDKGRSPSTPKPENDYDPSIKKFAGKPATDATVNDMVMEQAQRPLSKAEGTKLYWRSLANQHGTTDRQKILQKERASYVETFRYEAESSRKKMEAAKAKATKTKSAKVREKAEREARQMEAEIEEWNRIGDEWNNKSDKDFTQQINTWAGKWTDGLNRQISDGDPGLKEDAGYTIATVKTGWGRKDFTNTSFMQGTKQADDHLKDVIRSMGDNALGIKGKPKSAEELKSAYRRAAQKAHPDAGGSAEKFQEVKESYESLKRRYGFDSLLDRIDSLLEALYA